MASARLLRMITLAIAHPFQPKPPKFIETAKIFLEKRVIHKRNLCRILVKSVKGISAHASQLKTLATDLFPQNDTLQIGSIELMIHLISLFSSK
jgi:hypothetical protein